MTASGRQMSASGLSAQRLGTLRKVLTGHVARGDVPGLVAMVARGGALHVEAIGRPKGSSNRSA